MKRSIILFPHFDNMDVIQKIRKTYDPLFGCIAPHITIVFPFESDASVNELWTHYTEALKEMKKFSVCLEGITGDFRDGYIFLNVKKGNDQIIELHDRLYSGILHSYLYKKVTYCPHLTLGRLQDAVEFDEAIQKLGSLTESFISVIDTVYLENIDASENSVIEFSVDLE